MHLTDRGRGDGHRVPLLEQLLRRPAQLLDDHLTGQLGTHGRRVGLQLGQGGAQRLGQALVEIADHLADLHQRALHLPQGPGDIGGGAQLQIIVQFDAALG